MNKSFAYFLILGFIFGGLLSSVSFSVAKQSSPADFPSSELNRRKHDPILIESQSQLVSYTFPGSGTKDDPYRIENYRIIYESSYGEDVRGIYIMSISSYVLIRNNYIKGFYCGIDVIKTSDKVSVMANELDANECGIEFHYTTNQRIIGNKIVNNREGHAICLYSSYNITVQYNEITDCGWIGINTGYGVTNCEFSYNTVERSGKLVPKPEFPFFAYPYGIRLSSLAFDNIVHHNNFVDNNPEGTCQALDDGETGNQWYDHVTQTGNYWSDLGNKDVYYIEGPSSNNDIYPLKEFLQYDNPYNTAGDLISWIISIMAIFSFTAVVMYRKKILL
ncbi:MAG: hypothetical protein GOP50_08790 [Candidatus Heimdallarchaeota archaeon]|nr:hypothetical protein [Candidatus Heimdallarchaeota archaeon]